MYYNGVQVCSIFNLRIQVNDCDENTTEMREDYAKISLLMFYPFQQLDDIVINGSYCKLFYRELCLFKRNKTTTIWKKGFEILQNIENHCLLQHNIPKWLDYFWKNTVNKFNTDGKSKKRTATIEEEKTLTKFQGKTRSAESLNCILGQWPR